MAQFVVQNKFVPQPVIFQSQLVQPVVVVPNQKQAETEQLLRKESNQSLRLRKFLFFSPVVFFLVLLVFSSVIYGLRFERSNKTTPAAAQTLINLGDSFSQNPILELRVLPKYKNNDVKQGLNTCNDLLQVQGTVGENYWNPKNNASRESQEVLDRFDELVLDTFQQIRDGCVCAVQKYGRSTLTYHDVDYCEERKECKRVHQANEVPEKIFFGSLFCVRRAKAFLWKKSEEKCEDIISHGQKMRECGKNFCVSTEEGLYGNGQYSYQTSNLCPISRVQVVSRSQQNLVPAVADRQSRNGDNTREVIHFDNNSTLASQVQLVTYREYTNRPVINLHASISTPQCLASQLQRPLRSTHRSYKLQQVRETGCWPYGAHVSAPAANANATLVDVYPAGLAQQTVLEENDIQLNNIAFYKDYILDKSDLVYLYAELRPNIDQSLDNQTKSQTQCRENGIQDVSVRAKSSIEVLDVVEYYSFTLIITSAVGLLVTLVFLALRNKRFVNQTTQTYLYVFVALNGLALFVFACVFWNYVDRYNTSEIQDQLFYQFDNNCYMYEGQVNASRHLYALVQYINNEIFGLVTFLFVFDVLYFAGVVASVVLRRRDQLAVLEPVKSEGLYYE